MSSIPGLEHLEKEGWEIVGFDHVSQDEWFVDSEGRIIPWGFAGRSIEKKIIVRKIERPKQYRPFANAAEFKPHRERWIAKLHSDGRVSDGCFRVDSYDNFGAWVGSDRLSFDDMFDAGQQFDDGTPFGVEVTS